MPEAPQPAYRYRAKVDRVVDGDTLVLEIDLGFRVSCRLPIRLRGWNAPELSTPEGVAAARHVEQVCARAKEILIESYKDRRSFERWVADVWVDGRHLGEILREGGYGKPSPG